MSELFGRKASLVVSTGSKGLDLSELHFRFQIVAEDYETPNYAVIRVWNLSDKTLSDIRSEFQQVTINAGYSSGSGNYGVVFQGTIKQIVKGVEQGSTVNRYVDILAADGDANYVNGYVSHTLAAGASPPDILAATVAGLGLPLGYSIDANPQTLSRGKVMMGQSRFYLRRIAENQGCSWSIQNGQVQLVPIRGYLPGEAVVLNAKTGLLGIPQATVDGVLVQCLLNPNLRVSGLIQLNNAAIQQELVQPSKLLKLNTQLDQIPTLRPKIPTETDGYYKILVNEITGDTRGSEWYNSLVCLSIDKSSNQVTGSVN